MTPVFESCDACAGVFWPSSFAQRGDAIERRRRSYPGPSGFSLRQSFVGQASSNSRRQQTGKAIQGVAIYAAIVQSESEFIDVAAKVFLAHVVIDAVDAALQNCPGAFDSIHSYIAPDKFSETVIDRFVSEEKTVKLAVSCRFVGVDRRARLDVFINRGAQVDCVNGHDGIGNRATGALAQTDDRSFSNGAASHVELPGFMLVRFFASNVSFVYLDRAAQFLQIVAARLADSMEQKPSSFLSDTDLLGELERADTLAGGDEQIHGIQPLMQRDMRALEDRTSSDGKILSASITAIKAVLARSDALAVCADRTAWTIWPTAVLQISPCRRLVGKHSEKLKGADCDVVVHGSVPQVAIRCFMLGRSCRRLLRVVADSFHVIRGTPLLYLDGRYTHPPGQRLPILHQLPDSQHRLAGEAPLTIIIGAPGDHSLIAAFSDYAFFCHFRFSLALVATLIVETNIHHTKPFVKGINCLNQNIFIGVQVPQNRTVLSWELTI